MNIKRKWNIMFFPNYVKTGKYLIFSQITLEVPELQMQDGQSSQERVQISPTGKYFKEGCSN